MRHRRVSEGDAKKEPSAPLRRHSAPVLSSLPTTLEAISKWLDDMSNDISQAIENKVYRNWHLLLIDLKKIEKNLLKIENKKDINFHLFLQRIEFYEIFLDKIIKNESRKIKEAFDSLIKAYEYYEKGNNNPEYLKESIDSSQYAIHELEIFPLSPILENLLYLLKDINKKATEKMNSNKREGQSEVKYLHELKFITDTLEFIQSIQGKNLSDLTDQERGNFNQKMNLIKQGISAYQMQRNDIEKFILGQMFYLLREFKSKIIQNDSNNQELTQSPLEPSSPTILQKPLSEVSNPGGYEIISNEDESPINPKYSLYSTSDFRAIYSKYFEGSESDFSQKTPFEYYFEMTVDSEWEENESGNREITFAVDEVNVTLEQNNTWKINDDETPLNFSINSPTIQNFPQNIDKNNPSDEHTEEISTLMRELKATYSRLLWSTYQMLKQEREENTDKSTLCIATLSVPISADENDNIQCAKTTVFCSEYLAFCQKLCEENESPELFFALDESAKSAIQEYNEEYNNDRLKKTQGNPKADYQNWDAKLNSILKPPNPSSSIKLAP